MLRAPNIVRREPAPLQTLEVLREQLDRLSARVDQAASLATHARNGTTRDFLFKHIEGLAAYCDHRVRFGVLESINTTIKGKSSSPCPVVTWAAEAERGWITP
jgi:hypothetical protein